MIKVKQVMRVMKDTRERRAVTAIQRVARVRLHRSGLIAAKYSVGGEALSPAGTAGGVDAGPGSRAPPSGQCYRRTFGE